MWWMIELVISGKATAYWFDNAEKAQAFREAAESGFDSNSKPLEVTLWYRGRKYGRAKANEIAHYYEQYTQTYVLYAPDCKALYEHYSVKELFKWAQAMGIGTVVKGEAEARHLNRGD